MNKIKTQNREKILNMIIEKIKENRDNNYYCPNLKRNNKIKKIIQNNWINFNLLLNEVEELFEIIISDDRDVLDKLWKGTVENFASYVAILIENSHEEELNREEILNKETLEKIRWTEKDKECYKRIL